MRPLARLGTLGHAAGATRPRPTRCSTRPRRRPCPVSGLKEMGIERDQPRLAAQFRNAVNSVFMAAWTGVLVVADFRHRSDLLTVLRVYGATKLLDLLQSAGPSSHLVPTEVKEALVNSLLYYNSYAARILAAGEVQQIGNKLEIQDASALVTAARNCFLHELEQRTLPPIETPPPAAPANLGHPSPVDPTVKEEPGIKVEEMF